MENWNMLFYIIYFNSKPMEPFLFDYKKNLSFKNYFFVCEKCSWNWKMIDRITFKISLSTFGNCDIRLYGRDITIFRNIFKF